MPKPACAFCLSTNAFFIKLYGLNIRRLAFDFMWRTTLSAVCFVILPPIISLRLFCAPDNLRGLTLSHGCKGMILYDFAEQRSGFCRLYLNVDEFPYQAFIAFKRYKSSAVRSSADISVQLGLIVFDEYFIRFAFVSV